MNEKSHFLLIEDDDVDIMTMKRAFKDLKIPNPLNVVRNGEEAISFLGNENNPKPSIILLDLNMPKMTGLELLKKIKDNDMLKAIPVIIFTTSNQEKDKVESFKLGIGGYMVKPIDYAQFVEKIKTIHLYWSLCELPTQTV